MSIYVHESEGAVGTGNACGVQFETAAFAATHLLVRERLHQQVTNARTSVSITYKDLVLLFVTVIPWTQCIAG